MRTPQVLNFIDVRPNLVSDMADGGRYEIVHSCAWYALGTERVKHHLHTHKKGVFWEKSNLFYFLQRPVTVHPRKSGVHVWHACSEGSLAEARRAQQNSLLHHWDSQIPGTVVIQKQISLYLNSLVMAFSSLVRTLGKCSTTHSPPALFFFLKWRLACAY